MSEYVLLTAASNEQDVIPGLLDSVKCQTILPLKHLIVVNNSQDSTGDIARAYAARHSFLEVHEIEDSRVRSFSAQVRAFSYGYSKLSPLDFEFVGNVDADITLERDHCERCLAFLKASPSCGLTGGTISECIDEKGWKPRTFNSNRSVAHATQFFRRVVFEEIGGYKPLRFGGPDWLAEIEVRMCGWGVQPLDGLEVKHHRRTGETEGRIASAVRQGRMDWAMGSWWMFEGAKIVRRLIRQPSDIYPVVRFISYAFDALQRFPSDVPESCREYLRREQKLRLLNAIRLV